MTREPLAIVAAIVAAIQLLPIGRVIFGLVDWSAEQLAFLELAIITLAGIPGAIFARSKVAPTMAVRHR